VESLPHRVHSLEFEFSRECGEWSGKDPTLEEDMRKPRPINMKLYYGLKDGANSEP